MPVSANFSMEAYNSRSERGRRSSESSSASDATRERRVSTGIMHKRQVSAEATENIPTRRKSVGPKPASNPMKFVAAGPAPLLRTASEQMIKAEKLRMAAKPAVKEEESAAWQNNLDNWKSSRRKRQEDVIERLTEVKKMEEDVGGSRRRNKTFGEMMQDRSGKGRRVLQVFTDDDNDISSLLSAKSPTSSDTKSDLGFATSSDTGSEPSDQQDPDKCAASPTSGEPNGHDSGTEEFTYDSAIQGYMKFAEKTAATTRLPPPEISSPSPSPSPVDPPRRREPSPRAVSPMERHEVRGSSYAAPGSVQAPASVQSSAPAPAPVKTGRPSVVLREKKAKVDVLKRRSMFEQRTVNEERSPTSQRRQQRKSVDLSDGLRHRIASLETISGGGNDEARWRPQGGKGDKFREKLAMFNTLENSREATADRRGPVEIPRQKSASDLRSRFERMAADEAQEPTERPRSSMERGERRQSEPEARHWRHGSLDARRSQEADRRPEGAEMEVCSLEATVRQPEPVRSAVPPVTAVERPVDRPVEQPVDSPVEPEHTPVTEDRPAVASPALPLTNGHSLSPTPPEPARVPPVPRVRSRVPAPAPRPQHAPPTNRPEVQEVVERATVQRPVHRANIYRLFQQEGPGSGETSQGKQAGWAPVVAPGSAPAPYTAPAPAPAPVAAPVPFGVMSEPAPVVQESTPASDPVSAAVEEPASEPDAVKEPEPVTEPEPEPASVAAPASAVWQDPASAVDEMEAQILRQLEESERSQMSAPEVPVVLDFSLQPSSAPPPSEKPPPPPPEEEETGPPVEARPAKSTSAVKKDLYRRRSDFLGIQGGAEQEPVPAVARPPDMESLLREERAAQQEQERRRQAQETARRREQARQESLRRAEQEAEARAEEFRRRAQQEQEQRAQERRALELQQEQERLQELERQQEQQRQEEQEQERLLEQQRQQQEQERLQEQERFLDQQRRAQEDQDQEWRRRNTPATDPQERWTQESLSAQEREWRRRKERLSDQDVDRQEREIMESLEQEESWRHSQQRRYQSRLARQQQWQQTQECPPGGPGGGSSDLLSSRQQARSNPNLLQDAAPNPLLPSRSHGDLGPNPLMPSRSHGDLQAPGAGPLQQSRSHGRLYGAESARQGGHTGVQPAHPVHPNHQTPAQSAPNPTPPPAPAPAKPQRTADQEPRAARPPSSRSQRPQQTPSPTEGGPGQMTRHTLHALSAAPRSNLRQEWVPRKRADAPRNAGQHWLIQEAEQRRISEQQERSSRSQQPPQHHPAPYQAPRAPPPVQQHPSAQHPAQHPHPPHPQSQPQQQYPAYYTQQPIYENTPAQLNSNNYQDINTVRPNYGTQVYHSPEMRSTPESSTSPPSTQSPEERVLSVSGRKKCSHCGEELGRGAAMIIESLRLFYHINCFKCCVCNVQLGNGSMGADVRVRNNKLHCHDCYSNDEGLKFSKV